MMKKKYLYFVFAAIIVSLLLSSCAQKKFDYYKEDLSKYVTLGEYKGISVDVENVAEVTDEDVQEKVNEFLKKYGEKIQVTDRAAADGDTVNIDFVGKLDGEAFDGGSDEDYDLTLGSDKFIDGFEDGIVGKVPSETPFDLTLTFPSEYPSNPSLAGKTVVFTVTLNYIHDVKLPDYTDDLVKEKTDYETKEEYEKSIRDDLVKQRDTQLMQKKLNAVWNKIVENATILSLPQKRIDEFVDGAMDYYKDLATAYSVDFSEFLSLYLNTTKEELIEKTTEEAKKSVKEELIFYAIVKAENYSISDDEYTAGLKNYAEEYEMSEEEMESRYGKDIIRDSLLWDKVLEDLSNKAVINWTEPAEDEAD